MKLEKNRKLQQMPCGGKSFFVTIPKAMIELLDWKKGEEIKIILKDNKLEVKKC